MESRGVWRQNASDCSARSVSRTQAAAFRPDPAHLRYTPALAEAAGARGSLLLTGQPDAWTCPEIKDAQGAGNT